ncbi:MAG: hypothetical protein ABI539_01435 [Acidobacteriota bacterium]
MSANDTSIEAASSGRSGPITVFFDLAKETVKNFLMGFGSFRRLRLSRPRSTASYTDTDDYLRQFAFYSLELLRENVGELNGLAICEIGAGDTLASGFSMLAAGAAHYSVIDRFPGNYSSEAARRSYREIATNWANFYPHIPWDPSLDPESFPDNYPDRVSAIAEGIETARTELRHDIVCSFQVGEHVDDVQEFAAMHRRLLKPGGFGLHRVDFGPHDCWAFYDDLTTFLRFSDRLWWLTGSNRGIPNRKRHHEFLEAFDKAGLETEVLHLDHFDETKADLSRLSDKFQKMPRESVLVRTAIYKLRLR